jgi:hypothetical protein
MGQVIQLLLLALLTPGLVFSQDNAPKSREEVGANLRVTASIIEQTECLDYTRFDTNRKPLASIRVKLRLGVAYTNTGKYPIILHKSCGLISASLISHTRGKAESHFYEVTEFHQSVPTTLRPGKNDQFPSDSFVVIQPGGVYEAESTTSFLIDYSGTLPEPSYEHLSAEDHHIRFGVLTDDGRLFFSEDLDYLRARWMEYGYLWTGGVYSEPITIQLNNAQYFGQCE